MNAVQGSDNTNPAATVVGEIVAKRLSSVIEAARGSRVVYAMVDLGKEVTCAIGQNVSRLQETISGRIEVAIHPDLATEQLPRKLVSTDAATWFRNHGTEGTLATVFSVPGQQMEKVLQSLGSVERINHSWILDPTKAEVWADRVLPTYIGTDIHRELTRVLEGLMESGILASSKMLGEFGVSVRESMTGDRGLTLPNAVRHALPCLRLPRNCITHNEATALISNPTPLIRRFHHEFQRYLYLRNKRGELRLRTDMLTYIDKLVAEGDLSDGDANVLRILVNDKGVTTGVWRPSQHDVAQLPWPRIHRFFVDARPQRIPLGEKTIQFLDEEHPGTLKEDEQAILSQLKDANTKSTPQLEAIYFHHRERLRERPQLYKQWHWLIFDKPIEEDDDLLPGLVALVERALRTGDDVDTPNIVIELRGGSKKSFWTKNKNADLCGFLRDRYRGIDSILGSRVELRFGLCWSGTWENEIAQTSKNRKAGKSREFEFEAYLVPQSCVSSSDGPNSDSLGRPAAQLVWKPEPGGFATALSTDLRSVLPAGEDSAHLLRCRVTAAQGSSGSKLDRPTLGKVASVIDSYGQSEGHLANPGEDDATSKWNRISEWWPSALRVHSSGVLDESQQNEALRLFQRFRSSYSNAIAALTTTGGTGLASQSLVEQAVDFGKLLEWLRKHAISDVLVRQVWGPLLSIGTAIVEGDAPVVIVAPWHPLRLLELAAKAHQATSVIKRLVETSPDEAASIEDYVNDRLRSLRDTYYGNTALAGSRLLVETEQDGGYSILQPADSGPGTSANLTEKPVKQAVSKFGEIARHYLDLNPHDRANFSVVLYDSESEDLPVMLAKHLAQQIQQQPDLRCDLTVSHTDSGKLRTIYEHQNRRLGRELESSLTSEAARTFVSRLRIGITAQPLPDQLNGHHEHDILLLHDVLAPHADVDWQATPMPVSCDSPLEHRPNDMSRRKSLSKGTLSTSVYLTAPFQLACTQPYLDVLHDSMLGTPSEYSKHFIPAQKLEIASGAVRDRLNDAHRIARWVVTHDRIADRRVIGREDDCLRVLRYFSAPRSRFNTIVSTEEITRTDLRSRLEEDLRQLLPSCGHKELESILDAIHKRAIELSGGILMRGSLWDNYARELVGVIVAQREIEILLEREVRNRRTAMFFLDEIRDWLDIKGEIADILAIDLQELGDSERKLHLVIAEAKCIGKSDVSSSQSKSWDQLDETYTAIVSRFCDSAGSIDQTIWYKRLADLLVEHMTPWASLDRLGGWSFDDWLEGIRRCEVAVEVSAHSVIAVHNEPTSAEGLGLRIADPRPNSTKRPRIAQWTLGADSMAKSIRGIVQHESSGLLHVPAEWHQDMPNQGAFEPHPPQRHGGQEQPQEPPEDRDGHSPPRGVSGQTDGEPRVEPLEAGAATPTHSEPEDPSSVPEGWKREVFGAISSLSRGDGAQDHQNWLEKQTQDLRRALQSEGFDAPVKAMRLTPNAGLVWVDGKAVDINWLVKHQVDRLLVRHSLKIVRITPKPGHIVVAIERPKRTVLHLADAWLRRELGPGEPMPNLAPVVGEKEDDGELFYLPLAGSIANQPPAVAHTLVSGTTGSGKGILAANLILDVCAFNHPNSVEIYLIDPKLGADYLWALNLPHLRSGIVSDRDAATDLLDELVDKMEERYKEISKARCPNIAEFNRKCDPSKRLPYIIILFDEVANWMQDESFKKKVDGILNRIATKSRAAGLHLIMIYQRADNYVMTMQLRTNLGNKLILKLGDQGSSKIALGEKGAENLLGAGHIIADIGTGDKIYGQVPFIAPGEARTLAEAIRRAWSGDPE